VSNLLKVVVPVAVGLAMLLAWQLAVRQLDIPAYVLPAPSDIFAAFLADFGSLMFALWVTLRVAIVAFLLALATGTAIAILFSLSRVVELALYPYAVILQVTPVISIAPLILIWVGFERIEVALLIIAWIVAFFPVLANTTLGIRSTDRNLIDLFRLYGARRWQILWRLQLPSALPYILGAMKISGGLALIGVIVAEFSAGSGNDPGIGWTITEAGNRLHIAKMFAAMGLLSFSGVAIFFFMSGLEWLFLRRWHESALKAQS
jgi:NitT/TauT family transport system permease protein